MANILINGVKAKTGGGKSIFNTYLTLLREAAPRHHYFVLTPDRSEYEKYAAPHLTIVDIPDRFKGNAFFPVMYFWSLPRLFRRHAIDAILNFGDVVIPTDIPQIYQFDWAHGVYPEGEIWDLFDPADRIYSELKYFFVKRYLPRATVVAAQTEVIADRLRAQNHLKEVVVIPNAVALSSTASHATRDFGLDPDRRKLLYLAHYYPNKNVEIFLDVAREIRRRALPYQLLTTLAADQHERAAAFLEAIGREGLGDVIVNIGPVPMTDVAALFAQSDAMLMPTLLESFSGSYVEAMFHRRTILTSDRDFARGICEDAAYYFDPRSAISIIDTVEQAFADPRERERKIARGAELLDRMPGWDRIFAEFQDLVDRMAKLARAR